MKTIVEVLTEKLSQAFHTCGYSPEFGAVTPSDRPDLCQFQCNGAFSAAKAYKKLPLSLQEMWSQSSRKTVYFKKYLLWDQDL